MKTVFKSDEIPHIWMHQSAPYGRSASALSFNGPALLSYSTEIARLIEHKGRRAIVINERSFSISTSKHQTWMRQALLPESELPRFYVSTGRSDSLPSDGKQIYEFAIQQTIDAAAEEKTTPLRRKAVLAHLQAQQSMWLERARAVSEFFGLRKKADEKAIARFAAAKANQERKQAKAQKEYAAQQAIRFRESYEAWIAGSQEFKFWPSGLFPTAFRIEGEELVSSLGARVPLQAARIAIRFALSKRGQEWRENGERCPVGNYALSAINEFGVIAGCHRISWAEIERIAPMLSNSVTA